jgi:hypothetical protein
MTRLALFLVILWLAFGHSILGTRDREYFILTVKSTLLLTYPSLLALLRVGGIYSTINDLTTFGQSFLSSTLPGLTPTQIRQWMKPAAHTALQQLSVGKPWEIFRFTLPSDGTTVDLYTKSGDVGSYSSMLALSPQHNFGFVILAAGAATTTNVRVLSDIVTEVALPVINEAARQEAQDMYAGTYVLEIEGGGNSSITLATEADKPGLGATEWTSNGTDVFKTLSALTKNANLSIRLYPTGVETGNSNEVSFRAIFEDASTFSRTGIFSSSCQSWFTMDSLQYGEHSLDEFVFTLGGDAGKAAKLESKALRAVMERDANASGDGQAAPVGAMQKNQKDNGARAAYGHAATLLTLLFVTATGVSFVMRP